MVLMLLAGSMLAGCDTGLTGEFPEEPTVPPDKRPPEGPITGMADAYPGYAVPYDVFNNNQEILIFEHKADDPDVTGTIFVTHHDGYVYRYGYIYTKNGWERYELAGNPVGNSNWLRDNGEYSLSRLRTDFEVGENYLVAYSCKKHSGSWKCGCADQNSCGMWMLQAFTVEEPRVCEEGAKLCEGNILRTCIANAWVDEPCGADEICDADECACVNLSVAPPGPVETAPVIEVTQGSYYVFPGQEHTWTITVTDADNPEDLELTYDNPYAYNFPDKAVFSNWTDESGANKIVYGSLTWTPTEADLKKTPLATFKAKDYDNNEETTASLQVTVIRPDQVYCRSGGTAGCFSDETAIYYLSRVSNEFPSHVKDTDHQYPMCCRLVKPADCSSPRATRLFYISADGKASIEQPAEYGGEVCVEHTDSSKELVSGWGDSLGMHCQNQGYDTCVTRLCTEGSFAGYLGVCGGADFRRYEKQLCLKAIDAAPGDDTEVQCQGSCLGEGCLRTYDGRECCGGEGIYLMTGEDGKCTKVQSHPSCVPEGCMLTYDGRTCCSGLEASGVYCLKPGQTDQCQGDCLGESCEVVEGKECCSNMVPHALPDGRTVCWREDCEDALIEQGILECGICDAIPEGIVITADDITNGRDCAAGLTVVEGLNSKQYCLKT
ncbi:hypothetical protein COT48_06360 [Candidatus Woesearchaeota archaeon CG08_land_8_20_14_0_20_47_9]|nr:MAG: hypothetical protein COT48_06360 [Candidatus Woesearchaeota archaeon CG08_land_8_20_14_0_20_47_9]